MNYSFKLRIIHLSYELFIYTNYSYKLWIVYIFYELFISVMDYSYKLWILYIFHIIDLEVQTTIWYKSDQWHILCSAWAVCLAPVQYTRSCYVAIKCDLRSNSKYYLGLAALI